MTYAPKARVIVSSLTDGPERRALIVARLAFGEAPGAADADPQVNDAGAWLVRTADGRRLTVSESQLRPNTKQR